MTPERNPTIAKLFAVPEVPPPVDVDEFGRHSGRPGEAAAIMNRYRKAAEQRRKQAGSGKKDS